MLVITVLLLLPGTADSLQLANRAAQSLLKFGGGRPAVCVQHAPSSATERPASEPAIAHTDRHRLHLCVTPCRPITTQGACPLTVLAAHEGSG